jgi:hypothetical protein
LLFATCKSSQFPNVERLGEMRLCTEENVHPPTHQELAMTQNQTLRTELTTAQAEVLLQQTAALVSPMLLDDAALKQVGGGVVAGTMGPGGSWGSARTMGPGGSW